MKREEFLKDMDEYSNHRVLLWEALELTDGRVVEFGSGRGSTPFLTQYCSEADRTFLSCESNSDWAAITDAFVVDDWSRFDINETDVLFLDHAPGERRKVDLMKYKDAAKIIVIHDSEPKGWNSSDYQVRPLFDQFKFKVELKSVNPGGAWATMLSNFIDLSACVGKSFEEHIITA